MKLNKVILSVLFFTVIGIILYLRSIFTAELSTIEHHIETVHEHHVKKSHEVADYHAKVNIVPMLLWKFVLADTPEKKLFISKQLNNQIAELDNERIIAFSQAAEPAALDEYVQENWRGYRNSVLETINADSNGDSITAREKMVTSLIYLERLNNAMKLIVDFHQNDVAEKTAEVTAITRRSKQDVLVVAVIAILSFSFVVFITFQKIMATEKKLRLQVNELAEKNLLLAEKSLKIKQLAYEDSLTGLANRYAFQSALAKELADLSQNGHGAVIFFDMDNFKLINDSYGHDVGDQFLSIIGTRIKTLPDDRIFGSRFGGDEFALLLRDMYDGEVKAVLDSLFELVFIPIQLQDILLSPTASVGAAYYPLHGRKAAELLKKADIAMYQAKAAKNTYVIYNSEA